MFLNRKTCNLATTSKRAVTELIMFSFFIDEFDNGHLINLGDKSVHEDEKYFFLYTDIPVVICCYLDKCNQML